MTIEALGFFDSNEGRKILEEYREIRVEDLPSLAIKLSKQGVPFAAEITSLQKLRLTAADKFSKSSDMYFTADGLEQSSGEKVSRYIAGRFRSVIENGTVTDLTTGVGGNAIFLAENFPVRAVDLDAVHLACAKHNAVLYGVAGNIEFIHGRAEDNIRDSQAFIIDPQRIRTGKTKTRSIYNSQPDVAAMLPRMLGVTEEICIKISPAFDYEEIKRLPGEPGVEVISEDDNNKAALLWFGRFKNAARKATILDGDVPVSFSNQLGTENLEYADSLKKYLVLPNKAIIKAGLIGEISSHYRLSRLSPTSDWLTVDHLDGYAQRVFRSFVVVDHGSFSVKKTREMIERNGISRANIVARHFGVSPEDLRKRFKLGDGGGHTLIFLDYLEKKETIIAKNL